MTEKVLTHIALIRLVSICDSRINSLENLWINSPKEFLIVLPKQPLEEFLIKIKSLVEFPKNASRNFSGNLGKISNEMLG